MCGIVGLFLKNKALEPQLGSMLSGMLATMCDRGPDSAGFAVYGSGDGDHVKLTLRATAPGYDFAALAARLSEEVGAPVSVEVRDSHGVFTVPEGAEREARRFIEGLDEGVTIVGSGTRMEIYKEVGRPDAVAKRFHLENMSGSHGIAHTRMATESAVTTNGAHPFSTGRDQCLVHNGSLSNHNALRRQLKRHGLSFETDNDTEVAAGYLTWRMSKGKEERGRRRERYGITMTPRPAGPLIWVHAASVGESLAVAALVERILGFGISVVLTTGTVTSATVVRRKFGDDA